MTPTLFGRIQTRLFLLFVVGLPLTLVIAPFLPTSKAAPSRIGDLYQVTLLALVFTAVFGCVIWEPIWQFLQQFRWEKDWPAFFFLLEAIPEGLLVWFALQQFVKVRTEVGFLAFVIDFGLVWLAVFFAAHGPMRVPFLRWRFRGGQFF